MSALLMGGKAVADVARPGKPVTSSPRSQRRILDDLRARYPELAADPIPAVSPHDTSFLADVGAIWVGQGIEDLHTVAWRRHRLGDKLRDPALMDHPLRPDYEPQLDELRAQMAGMMADLCYLEATCDRMWQAMTPQERAYAAKAWDVTQDTPRLIGAVWRLAGRLDWPPRTVIGRADMANRLPWQLVVDMDAAGVFDLALGPVMPDPFERDVDDAFTKLARINQPKAV